MANLGSIGRLVGSASPTHGGTISGIVLDTAGLPTSRVIYALNTATFQIAAARSSAVDGTYSIYTDHKQGVVNHIVFERTPDGSENARIFDNVFPIPA